RLVELGVSLRHQTRLLAEGAEKVPEPFYPLMVGIHAGLFIASGLEVWLCERPFVPLLGWSMLTLLGLCLAGRVWVWRSLGEQWNVQIVVSARPVVDTGPYRYVRHPNYTISPITIVQIVVSARPVVDTGPYRYVRHPNYTIVIGEMFALPLVHSAYLTA